MSWRAITEDDVYARLTGPSGTALRAALIEPGQQDPLVTTIATVTAEVREAIASHPGNRNHATVTFVPEAAIRHAVALIRLDLAERFAEVMEIPKEWKEAAETATDYLDKVAKGDRTVEISASEAGTSRAGSWNSSNKILGRTHPVPPPGSQAGTDPDSYANPDAPADRAAE